MSDIALGLGAFTALSVFADLCTVYITFKTKRQKPLAYGKHIARVIIALNTFKDTHSNAQKLHEFCTNTRNRLDFSDVTAAHFQLQIAEFCDKLEAAIAPQSVYEGEPFILRQVAYNQIIEAFRNELNGVCQAVESTRKLLKRLAPTGQSAQSWFADWRPSQFKAQDDVSTFRSFIENSEEPARKLLLHADAAILNSITLLRVFAVELLQ